MRERQQGQCLPCNSPQHGAPLPSQFCMAGCVGGRGPPSQPSRTPESAGRPPAPQRLSLHLVIFRSPGASPTALRRQLGKQTRRQIVPRLIPGKDAKSHPATPQHSRAAAAPSSGALPSRMGAGPSLHGVGLGNTGAYSCLGRSWHWGGLPPPTP